MKSLGVVVFGCIILLLSAVYTPACAQGVDPGSQALVEKYKNFDFKGAFSVKAEADETNNYFLVDMTRLQNRFERVYFMNQVFKLSEVVNIDPNIDKPMIWFQANRRYPEKSILDMLDGARAKTAKASADMSTDAQAEWLKSHDKYK